MNIKAIALTLGLSTIAMNAMAADDSVNYSIDIDQSISVNSPADPATAAAGEAIQVSWTVDSHNAFKYAFSGTSKGDDGSDNSFPSFSKQDIDASGQLVADNYDNLDTTFGVELAAYESVQTADTWGGASSATGTATDLVLDTAEADSPYGTMGRVMTGDDTGQAQINLFAKGVADATDQSGIYNAEVMLTVTAEEQL